MLLYQHTMGDKSLRTLSMMSLPFCTFPPDPPINVVVCAALHTLACPESVSSSQHCLERGGEDHCRYRRG